MRKNKLNNLPEVRKEIIMIYDCTKEEKKLMNDKNTIHKLFKKYFGNIVTQKSYQGLISFLHKSIKTELNLI